MEEGERRIEEIRLRYQKDYVVAVAAFYKLRRAPGRRKFFFHYPKFLRVSEVCHLYEVE